MAEVGDIVRIVGYDLYQGEQLPVGGVVITTPIGDGPQLYRVRIGNIIYELAPAEIELMSFEVAGTTIIEDDGYLD